MKADELALSLTGYSTLGGGALHRTWATQWIEGTDEPAQRAWEQES